MESAPTTPLVVAQAQLLFQFLIIALNNPTMFCDPHEFLERCVFGKSREPVLGGFRFAFRPFYEQPLHRMGFGQQVVPMCQAEANRSEARLQVFPRPFAPHYRLPSALANHWWQSTIVAAVAGLMALPCASTVRMCVIGFGLRHLKFLMPFSILALLGSEIAWR